MVGGVVVGAEYRVEETAGAVADLAEEGGFGWLVAVPMAGQRNDPAVIQYEPSDIDRVGRRVLAAPAHLPAIDVPAAIGAEVVDSGYPGAQVLARCRVQHVALEQVQGRQQRAFRDEAAAVGDGSLFDAGRVYQSAAVLHRSLWLSGEADTGFFQRSETGPRFLGKAGKLKSCEDTRLRRQVQRSPGVP